MKYVAFLRGINVGGRIIKMVDLKAGCEKLGLKDVQTWLQTGNVTFESSADASTLKQTLEAGLSTTFGYPAKVQIYPKTTLQAIIAAYPFQSDDDHHDYVVFLENGLEKQLGNEPIGANKDLEQLQVGQGVMYWRVKKGSTLSTPFAKYLTKTTYKSFNTNRNLRTLQKIAAS